MRHRLIGFQHRQSLANERWTLNTLYWFSTAAREIFLPSKAMAGKRQKTHYDFNILSTDSRSSTDDQNETADGESDVSRVLKALDAPETSKFYRDAQA
jgi:hypothetical protein